MATRLLIDGYNLIAALWGMGGTGPELARQRGALVEALARYRRVRGLPIHIVFDGWKEGDPFGNRERDHGIDITYSPKGVTADEVIRDLVREDAAGVVVITADKRVRGWANTAGADTVSTRDFIAKLIEAEAEAAEPDSGEPFGEEADEGEGWDGTTVKKGNPRRRSKKEKARGRGLGKL